MCFVLFVGTNKPLPIAEWSEKSPQVCIQPLNGRESEITQHFKKPVVQNVCSTSGCGCDFPHWLKVQGDVLHDGFDPRDEEQKQSDYANVEALASLLRESGEREWELYGVWYGDFVDAPFAVKSIALDDMSKADFFFHEQVFYRVRS